MCASSLGCPYHSIGSFHVFTSWRSVLFSASSDGVDLREATLLLLELLHYSSILSLRKANKHVLAEMMRCRSVRGEQEKAECTVNIPSTLVIIRNWIFNGSFERECRKRALFCISNVIFTPESSRLALPHKMPVILQPCKQLPNELWELLRERDSKIQFISNLDAFKGASSAPPDFVEIWKQSLRKSEWKTRTIKKT